MGQVTSQSNSDNPEHPEELLTALFHDLRSPLGAINVITDIISRSVERNQNVEPRQFLMLQDAVTKSQRILDDAIEMQSILRGSSTLTFSTIELKTLTQNCIDKARHAPYFKKIIMDYHDTRGEMLVRIDVEKGESTLLCVLEQLSRLSAQPTHVTVNHSICDNYGCINLLLDNEELNEDLLGAFQNFNLKGKLGTRRLGESRYNLHVCSRVVTQMGGELEALPDEQMPIVRIKLPLANL